VRVTAGGVRRQLAQGEPLPGRAQHGHAAAASRSGSDAQQARHTPPPPRSTRGAAQTPQRDGARSSRRGAKNAGRPLLGVAVSATGTALDSRRRDAGLRIRSMHLFGRARPDVSSPAMTRRITSAGALAALLVLLVLRCPSASAQTTRLQEFSFAVGAGGSAVNDTGRPDGVKTFSTGGFHAFFELSLDPAVLLQLRYESFQVPGSTAEAPRKNVDAGNVTVAYVFREAWWEAGLFAGVGLYGLVPRSPEAGQAPVDVRENVLGWNGGTVVVFQLARRWDLRVEAAGYLLNTDASTKLVRLGGSLAYRF